LALTIIFLVVYTIALIKWNKWVSWRLNPKTSRTIKYVHYIGLSIITIIAFVYWELNIGLRGLWTTRSIIFVTLFTGIFFNFISSKAVFNILETIYFRLFSLIPIFVGLALLIPFLGVVIVFSIFGQLTSPADKIYYEDKNLRIQSSFVGVLGPPRVDIFEKKGIFEEHLMRTDFNPYEFDSVKVKYDNDSTRLLVFGLAKTEDSFRVINLKKID
jgi:hypothetical protein